MSNPAPADHIGHYTIEAPLGRGSMGAVYLARDTRIGRLVALKQVQLSSDQFDDTETQVEFYGRLQREAEVCGSLQHPNIVTLYDVGYEDGKISYLALEYVAGETLLDVIKRHRPSPVPADFALRVTADILRALAYAHSKGIVHRDIKPANILIARDGTAKIADFGIARPHGSSMTVAGALMGTPNYMSPEQVKGVPATAQSDLFSVGVVLFELLTAVKPFAAADLQSILQNIVHVPMPNVTAINASVSPELDAFIQRLGAKNPEARYATAEDALAALEMLRNPPASPSPPTASPLRQRIPRRVFLAVVIAGILTTAIPAALIWRRIDARPTVQIPANQLAEFEQKREALRAADELFDNGQYEESLKAYEAYLAQYPESAAAREGAERARAEIGPAVAETGSSNTARRAKTKQRERPLMQDIKRSVRRLFGRN